MDFKKYIPKAAMDKVKACYKALVEAEEELERISVQTRLAYKKKADFTPLKKQRKERAAAMALGDNHVPIDEKAPADYMTELDIQYLVDGLEDRASEQLLVIDNCKSALHEAKFQMVESMGREIALLYENTAHIVAEANSWLTIIMRHTGKGPSGPAIFDWNDVQIPAHTNFNDIQKRSDSPVGRPRIIYREKILSKNVDNQKALDEFLEELEK